jgi:putative ABC transport system permease protein
MDRTGWLTIVGIVGDARYLALDEPDRAIRPMLYFPHRQMPTTPMTLMVRSGIAPESLAPSVRRTLTSEAGIALTRIDRMNGMLREASVSQRFTMNLVTVFAVTAVAIAVVGVYGLLAFLIGRRTKEIGVRVALGAQHLDIARTVVGRTLSVVGVGIAGGLGASVVLSEAASSSLFGVSPHDPITYVSVATGFVALSIAAATLPTLSALRIDPVRVIRAE